MELSKGKYLSENEYFECRISKQYPVLCRIQIFEAERLEQHLATLYFGVNSLKDEDLQQCISEILQSYPTSKSHRIVFGDDETP
ncbi:MAG: hypothetical protein AB9834_12665 [Lentimicrobium sp.]